MKLPASMLGPLAIKSLAVAGLALCLLRLARKRTPAERPVIAHLALLTLLILPLASLALPQWTAALQGDGTSAAISSSRPPGPPRDN